MGKLHDAIAAEMAAAVEGRVEWDELPMLYRLHLRDRQPRLHPIDLRTWGHAAIALGMRPPEALSMIADMMEAGRFRPPPDDPDGVLHGMAFRHEGWWAYGADGEFALNSAEGRLAMHHAKEHLIYTRPDRVEIRMMVAVDRAGITYQVIQPRGEERAERLIMFPNAAPEEPHATGLVVESLDRMVAQLCGVPAQPRPEPPGPEMN